MFSIDGWTYDFPMDVTRSVSMNESDVSGLLLSGDFYHDITGAYVSYNITMAVPRGREDDYAELFERLIEPQSHYFVLPYNQSELSFYGVVSGLSDKLYRNIGNTAIWRNVAFTVTSNQPRGAEYEDISEET